LLLCASLAPNAAAQDLDTVRADQVNKLKNYVVAAIQPSGLVRDSVFLNSASNHPATPDAAGFALLALAAIDQWDNIHSTSLLPDSEARVENILRGYAGLNPGVSPARSTNGHYIHFMNVNTGAPAGGGWDDSYSPISTALLVAGAQFAKNHFTNNTTIASLANQLTDSVNFNAAIHPGLSGAIYRDMLASGAGSNSELTFPWNEYMLVESLALRETNNARALAVKDLWLGTDNLPKMSNPFAGNVETLTDVPGQFKPAFLVQQMHFFNGDFRHSGEFETFFDNQKVADKAYSSGLLGQAYRYGLTAGVSPNGYQADSIFNHPDDVFSPEAVAAWGDMTTLMQFYANQVAPANDPGYKYGMVRVSADPLYPTWVPSDAGLVDHLYLLYGLVESVDPDFFLDRVFGSMLGDYRPNQLIDTDDYAEWRTEFGSLLDRGSDGNANGIVDAADYVLWRKFHVSPGNGSPAPVPEPGVTVPLAVAGLLLRRTRRSA
jgi:hypothetical protein